MLTDSKLSERLGGLPAAPVDAEAALAAVLRRGRRRAVQRRLATAAGTCLTLALVAAGVRLLPTGGVGAGPAGGGGAGPGALARTSWFRPTYLPAGYASTTVNEFTVALGPKAPQAQAFADPTTGGMGRTDVAVVVSVNPNLRRFDPDREARRYPDVAVVTVRGRRALLVPARPGGIRTSSGVTWQERDGLVLQVIGANVADADLLRVAEGVEVGGTGAAPTLRVTWAPAGFQRQPENGIGTFLSHEVVVPRGYAQTFAPAAAAGAAAPAERTIHVMEMRDQAGGGAGGHGAGSSPAAAGATVHGNPAVLSHDAAARTMTLTWAELGGVGLFVTVPERLGEEELHKIAEGLAQP
jgi:hypothetical protein